MNSIVRNSEKNPILKASSVFNFIPLAVTAIPTYFFMDAWWPIILFNALTLAMSTTLVLDSAHKQISRLYASVRYDYNYDIEEGKPGYRKDIQEKVSDTVDKIPSKEIAKAIIFKKPFDIITEDKSDETYGEINKFKVSFDGKQVEVQHIHEPSIFDIMTDAIGNARKLK